MQGVYEFLTGPVAADLIRALLHTLWQGLLLSGGLLLFLRLSTTERPGLRYWAATCCLLAVAASAAATFAVLRSAAAPGQPWEFRGLPVWLGGGLLMGLRILYSLGRVGRLRAASVAVTDAETLRRFEEVRSELGIRRRVGLRYCRGIRIPGAVGWLRPTVLLPESMRAEVDAETLRIVFAHALAHVRRHDYPVNLLQLLIEAALFFNPCVWWISRQVREEREACCEAEGVRVTGQRLEYARALLGWLERRPVVRERAVYGG